MHVYVKIFQMTVSAQARMTLFLVSFTCASSYGLFFLKKYWFFKKNFILSIKKNIYIYKT